MVPDASVDDIIEGCIYITSGLMLLLENFENAVERFDKVHHACSRIFNLEDISDQSVNNVQQRHINLVEGISCQVQKNEKYLKKMEEEMKNLEEDEYRLSCLVTKNEKQVKKSEAKILNINKKKESLQKVRDKVQMFKLLTNTSFIYEGSKISGYVAGKVSKEIKCFQLHPDELSKSEITEHLYDLLKKVSYVRK